MASERAKRHRIGQGTIFSNAQAAVAKPASGEPWTGPEVRPSGLGSLRREEPVIQVEIQWRPSHEGIAGNDRADEWARWQPVSRTIMGWSGSGSRTSTGSGIGCSPQAANLGKEVAGPSRGSHWQSTSLAISSRLSRSRPGRTRQYYQLKTGHALISSGLATASAITAGGATPTEGKCSSDKGTPFQDLRPVEVCQRVLWDEVMAIGRKETAPGYSLGVRGRAVL